MGPELSLSFYPKFDSFSKVCSPRDSSQEYEYGWKEWFCFPVNCLLITSRASWLLARKIKRDQSILMFNWITPILYISWIFKMCLCLSLTRQYMWMWDSIVHVSSGYPWVHYGPKWSLRVYLYSWPVSLGGSHPWIWKLQRCSFL